MSKGYTIEELIEALNNASDRLEEDFMTVQGNLVRTDLGLKEMYMINVLDVLSWSLGVRDELIDEFYLEEGGW